MSTILVTGASGFIGSALSAALAADHQVIAISRNTVDLPGVTYVKGEVGSFEDLRQLDKWDFDAVVHLAAELRGPERDFVMVNGEGSRCLMRYLIDQGCRKFVMASSIAAIGCQSVQFRPEVLPIPDEHPCYDLHGYGFSKFIMEEITRFYWRQNPEVDVINIRLCSVMRSDHLTRKPEGIRPILQWTVGNVTCMFLSDAIRAFSLAVLSPLKPGVRILNTAAERIWATVPTADFLEHWWGNEVDLSYFRKPGNEFRGVYSVDLIREELGFTAVDTLEYLGNRFGTAGR